MSDRKRVVLIDDDELFLESNKDLLEAYDFEVRTATSGAEGLQLVRQEVPDVVVLDVMMETDSEGFEVAREISADPDLKGVHILLVTGITHALHTRTELRPDENWLPVDRIMEKPISPERLIAEVRRAIQQKS